MNDPCFTYTMLLTALFIFFILDVWVNYLTYRGEAKFPSLNQKTIKEYRNKCFRGLIPLVVIVGWVYLR